MAKRKRLSPAVLTPGGMAPDPAAPPARAPVAHVAAEAAEHAAFSEVARTLTAAREEGRLIQKLPLEAIETGHLVRDRVAFDPAEMAALRTSLAARGQQVPVEVVALEDGRFGLISGLRRVMALRDLAAPEVLAVVRQPQSSAEAYLAMVEENEIRAGISFYERARLAAEAARLGLYATPAAAIAALFAAASPAKRSKIGAFVRVHEALGPVLHFPAAIPERLGLAMAQALEGQAEFATALGAALAAAPPADAAAERALIEAALKPKTAVPQTDPEKDRGPAPEDIAVAPGITMSARAGRVVLSGKGVTEELQTALAAWLAAR